MVRRGLLCVLAGWGMLCSAAFAEDAYFHVRLNEIEFSDGKLPNYKVAQPSWPVRQRVTQMQPDVQLDDAAEAYLQRGDLWSSVFDWSNRCCTSRSRRSCGTRQHRGVLLDDR